MVRITAIPFLGFLGLAALTTGAFASVGDGVNSNQNGNSLQGLTQYAQAAPVTNASSASSKKKPPKPPPPLPWCKKGEEKKEKQKKCKGKPKPYTPK